MVLCGSVGCIKRSSDTDLPPAPVVVQPQFVQHKVTRSGETLSSIAAAYTGRSQNWTKIRDANPQIKPNKLPMGAVINIPAELVTKKNVTVITVDRGEKVVSKTPGVSPVKRNELASKKIPNPVAPTQPDLIQVKKSSSPAAPLEPPPSALEWPVTEPQKPVVSRAGVIQETAGEVPPAGLSTSTTMPSVVDRIDPAPDREREKLLDELLSK